MTLLHLCWTFFYIGLFTIGGGQVAITLMYQPVVDGGLLTAEKFYQMVAISESTPGPIGINMATYIGCELYGVIGGILVTLSTVLPSLIIIMIIGKFFERYQNKPIIKTVFSSIRPVSAGLITVAAWNVFRISVINFGTDTLFTWQQSLLFIFLLVILLKTKISPIFVMILAAICGVLLL